MRPYLAMIMPVGETGPVDPGFGVSGGGVDPGYGRPEGGRPSQPIYLPPGQPVYPTHPIYIRNPDHPENPIVLPPGTPIAQGLPAAGVVISNQDRIWFYHRAVSPTGGSRCGDYL